jgi:hypothetical protein
VSDGKQTGAMSKFEAMYVVFYSWTCIACRCTRSERTAERATAREEARPAHEKVDGAVETPRTAATARAQLQERREK